MTDSQNGPVAIPDAFHRYYCSLSEDELQPPQHLERAWGYDMFAGENRRGEHVTNALHAVASTPVKNVYVTTGRYEHPAAATVDEKHWVGSDLTFEVTGRDLPSVTPSTPLSTVLDRARGELRSLVALLEDDLDFTVTDVVFNGDDGYRVIFRDGYVQSLTREQRETITEYVSGAVDPLSVTGTDPISTSQHGFGDGEERHVIVSAGGWGERTIARCEALTTRLQAGGVGAVKDQLLSLPGVTPSLVDDAVSTIEAHPEEFRNGVIDMSESVHRVAVKLIEQELAESSAYIDPEATTDLHRYVRVPGTLHGDTGLLVHRVDPTGVDEFDPLRDAVPDWGGVPGVPASIAVQFRPDAPDEQARIGGEVLDVVPGETVSLPTCAAVFAACRGWGVAEL